MDLEFLNELKKRVIIAMFSDDDLMEHLVLKGGNLLDIVYGISTRPSKDVDFSIPGKFPDLEVLRTKVEGALKATFAEIGYTVFDVTAEEKPDNLSDDLMGFWGGYKLYFKLIESGKYAAYRANLDTLRRHAMPLRETGSTKFPIEISQYEFCDAKKTYLLDDYTIFVYTPTAFVCEKIRAICQQMPEYVAIVRSHPTARARDFVDIHTVVEHFPMDFTDEEFQSILRQVFAVKRVPLSLIGRLGDEEYREYHRGDFPSVESSAKAGITLEGFDFYFDYVVHKCRVLETLWNE